MNVPRDPISIPGLDPGSSLILLGMAAALTLATLLRGAALLLRPSEEAREPWGSVGTWWVLLLLLTLVMIGGRAALVIVAAAISLLGLREAVRLAGVEGHRTWLALGTLLLYAWAWLDWPSLFLGVLPAVALLVFVGEIGWRLRPGYPTRLRATALGALAGVVGPSYVVAVASLPAPVELPRATLGWLLLLLVLTELNDIFQAWWGRALGAHPLTPTLSPGKTWEGFVGGLVTTVLLAVMLAPLVTSWGRVTPPTIGGLGPPWLWSGLVGLVVAVAGVAGDLMVSSLKRQAGVKDSGSLLPGQGGVLDRLDSLAATAPIYFFLTLFLWMGTP